MKNQSNHRATLGLLELPRAALEATSLFTSYPFLLSTRTGDGHGVFVIPGFATSDNSTIPLRGYLNTRGYKSRGWGLGRNFGLDRAGGLERLLVEFDDFAAKSGGKVSLIGWSLGGIHARRIAQARPDQVRQVISLGSPINGNPARSTVWRVYESVNGEAVSQDVLERLMSESRHSLGVPATSIYSKSDGVVPWHISQEPESDLADNIEVHSSHIGLGLNPVVYYLLSDRLSQNAGDWRKFDQQHLLHRMMLRMNPAWPIGRFSMSNIAEN